jgi:hypothetical protein
VHGTIAEPAGPTRSMRVDGRSSATTHGIETAVVVARAFVCALLHATATSAVLQCRSGHGWKLHTESMNRENMDIRIDTNTDVHYL